MSELKWYLVNVADEEIDHEWEQFKNDEEAIKGFREWAAREGMTVLEVWECADDECLSPVRCVY